MRYVQRVVIKCKQCNIKFDHYTTTPNAVGCKKKIYCESCLSDRSFKSRKEYKERIKRATKVN